MDSLTKQIDQLLTRWNRTDSPGCAVAVVQNGQIIFKKGYGMADLERNVPITPSSVFDVASTSKQFVAMCVLLLSNEEKLALDDDVRQYIPEMPGYEHPITIRHLIHHTSGIRDYLELMDLAGMPFVNDFYEQEIIALIARQQELNFQPGDEFLYSNSGYFFLGEIVKRVSGKSLGDFARERIFEPLGMYSTCYYDDYSRIVPNRTIGYSSKPDGGYAIELYMFDLVGDGGVLTSVEDLFLWDQNFYANKLGHGGQDLIEQMLTPGTLNSGERLDYAFGLTVGDYRGLRIVSHGGSWAGYRAELIRFPDQRFSVICLSNLASFNPTGLAKKVADIYLEDHFREGAALPGSEADDITLSEAELAVKSGAYRNAETGTVVKLFVENEKLNMFHPAGLVFEVIPTSASQFQSADDSVDVTLEFEGLGGDRPERLQITMASAEPALYEAVELLSLAPADLAEYAGVYFSSELEVTYQLLLTDDQLVRKLGFNPNASPLEPTVKDEFGLGASTVKFVRDVTGQIHGFDVCVGRVKNIRFKRVESPEL